MTPVELQWEWFRLAKKYAQDNEVDAGGDDVLDRWEHVLEGLERDPMPCSNELDWVAKMSMLEAYRRRDGLEWDHPKLKLIDLQYHDVRRPKSLYWKLVGLREDGAPRLRRGDRPRRRPSADRHPRLFPRRVSAPVLRLRSWRPRGTH